MTPTLFAKIGISIPILKSKFSKNVAAQVFSRKILKNGFLFYSVRFNIAMKLVLCLNGTGASKWCRTCLSYFSEISLQEFWLVIVFKLSSFHLWVYSTMFRIVFANHGGVIEFLPLLNSSENERICNTQKLGWRE